MKYVHNLGCFAARFMWSYSLGNQTLRTSAYVTLINKLRYTVYQKNVFQKIQLSIRVCVCIHACMYGCMDVNRVLIEICAQLGMLRCKVYVVVFLGEPNT